ncbi:hypothetical protein TCDM_02868 [Trypanosoma cruzi Dm28c]|uniref:Uncharacterized protein n=1 Tax=Trypanosoma cruzi Dm28c TaxID=1416333 RepID=V5B506_TRYCR|nr:hypothetical protein TCDM_02868 [Trypanosoma cruzi Dm28c]
MPRLDTSGLRETERQGEAADGKDTQGGSSTAHLSPTTVKHVSLLEAAASAAASRSASVFAESRGSVPQQMMPQMFAMSSIRDAHGAAIYQQVTPALRPHVAATTQFDSHAMAMPQTASQQQIPVVLVAMGDGRLTYCPVVASSYSPCTAHHDATTAYGVGCNATAAPATGHGLSACSNFPSSTGVPWSLVTFKPAIKCTKLAVWFACPFILFRMVALK